MPAARPNHLNLVEGNPSHKTNAELAKTGLKLPAKAPAEPDWSRVFVARPVFVPKKTRAESVEDRERREAAALDREEARADAKLVAAAASATWVRVVRVLEAQGLLAELDWFALQDLCVVVARIEQLERDISRRGFTVSGQKGSARNGSIVSAHQYRGQFRWLSQKLGLTPVDRDYINPEDPEGASDGDSPFD